MSVSWHSETPPEQIRISAMGWGRVVLRVAVLANLEVEEGEVERVLAQLHLAAALAAHGQLAIERGDAVLGRRRAVGRDGDLRVEHRLRVLVASPSPLGWSQR